MTYELAKQLKDAGFPFKQYRDEYQLTKDGQVLAYTLHDIDLIPTLPELIEACGDNLKCLNNLSDMNRWDAVSLESLGLTGIGITPEEAVTNLWLALNKHD